jgi:hypothetical protein
MSPRLASSWTWASHQGGPLILASRWPVADCFGDCGPNPGSVVIGRDGNVQVHPGSPQVLGDQGQSDHECLAAKAGLALAQAAWAGLPQAAVSWGGEPAGDH